MILSISMLLSLINTVTVNAEGYDYFVEAENYDDCNFRSTGGGRIQNKAVYSNGKYINLFHTSLDGDEYFAEYAVNVEKAGVYKMELASTPSGAGWCSPIYMSINGREPYVVGGAKTKSITGDTTIAYYDIGTVNLNQGMNTIRFIVRDKRESGEYVCFIDC